MKKNLSALLAIFMMFSVISPMFTISSAIGTVTAEKISYVCTKITETDKRYGEKQDTYTAKYDKNGNLLYVKHEMKGPFDSTEFAYTYDSKGRLASEKATYNYIGGGKDSYTKKYSYNSDNTIKEADGVKYSYKYDKNGNLTQINENNTPIHKYTYNSSSNITKDKAQYQTYKYTYDKNNRLTESSDGNKITKYTYDKNGNLKTQKDNNDVSFSFSDGKMTAFNEYGEKETYTYNKKGQLISKSGSVTTTKYTYDKHGNLTKLEERKDGRIVHKMAFTYKAISTVVATTSYGTMYFSYNDNYVATGKNIKPVVNVRIKERELFGKSLFFLHQNAAAFPENIMGKGYFFFEGIDYTVKYADNKDAGTGRIIIDFLNPEDDDITLTFTITPAKVKDFKVSSKGGNVTANWSKVTGAKYYRVQVSTDGKTWKTEKTVETNSAVIKSLKVGKKYQLRAIACDSTKKISGKPSTVKSITVKK